MTGWMRGRIGRGGLSALMALAFAWTAPATAQDDNDVVLYSFSADTVRPVIESMEAFEAVERKRTGRGSDYLQADFGGLRTMLIYGACNDDTGRCLGMTIISFWASDSYEDLAEITARAADFNRTYEFTKAGVTSSGSPFVSRYIIADHGVKRGNVRVQISTFLALAARFQDEVVNAGG